MKISLNEFRLETKVPITRAKKAEKEEKPLSTAEEKRILRKIARGESLTAEEREKLKKIEASKIMKAKDARRKQELLDRKVKNEKNLEKKEKLIEDAKVNAYIGANPEDSLAKELSLAGVKKVEEKNRTRKKLKSSANILDIRI